MSSSASSSVYSGLQTFGKGYAIYATVVGTLISLGMIALGIYLIRRKPVIIQGKVLAIHCTGAGTQYQGGCKAQVSVNLNCNDSVVIIDVPMQTKVDDILQLEENNGTLVLYQNTKPLGWGMVIIGSIVLIITWVILYLAFKSKTFAAVYGGMEGVGLARNLL